MNAKLYIAFVVMVFTGIAIVAALVKLEPKSALATAPVAEQPAPTTQVTPEPPELEPRKFDPTWLIWSDNGRIRWRTDVQCVPADGNQFQCMMLADMPVDEPSDG